jgi:hypothetical protein
MFKVGKTLIDEVTTDCDNGMNYSYIEGLTTLHTVCLTVSIVSDEPRYISTAT